MANANVISPKDVTATAVSRATKAREKAQKAQEEAARLEAEARALSDKNDIHDPLNQNAPIQLDEVEVVDFPQGNKRVIIRVVEDITDMTYGVGHTYNFKAGVKYEVDQHIADYLESLGYVWFAD